ncbi:MAG: anti-sigma factor family protein, partial [Planctomycetota bacterium]
GVYLDSELDTETTARINAHLEHCPSCARRFRAERRLDRLMAERLLRPEAGDAALFERTLAKGTSRSRPRLPMLLAAAAVLGTAASVLLLLLGRPAAPSLLDLALRNHTRHAGEAGAAGARIDPAYVEAARVGLGGPMPPRGYELAAAHACRLGSVPVRYLGLRRHGRLWSVFVIDHPDAVTFLDPPLPETVRATGGIETVAVSCGEVLCVVVGPDARELAGALTEGAQ